MGLMDIYKNYDMALTDCILKYITEDINKFELKDVVDFIKQGYAFNDIQKNKMTTLFNSIFTHHSQTFMLTRRSFYWLVKKDPNVNSNSLSGQEYSAMISKMLSSGDFIYLREPVGRKAGVLKVVNPDIVQTLYRLHGKEWFDMQEQKVCDYYDNKTDLEKPKTSFKDNFNKFKEDTKDEW